MTPPSADELIENENGVLQMAGDLAEVGRADRQVLVRRLHVDVDGPAARHRNEAELRQPVHDGGGEGGEGRLDDGRLVYVVPKDVR